MKLKSLNNSKTGSILNSLCRNSVAYLSDVSPSMRSATALQLAEKYFNRKNFVPGFPDMIVVTTKALMERTNREYRKLKPNYSLATFSSIPGKLVQKPDLLWIDVEDEKIIRQLEIKYYGVPTIYTRARAGTGARIIVDSREKNVMWSGPNYKKMLLNVGDYTTDKLLNIFHVERKSPEDLYSTLLKGHVRFRNEILRAERSSIKLALFVECSKKDFVSKNFKGGNLRKTEGETLEKIINTVEQRYKLEVIWCRTRPACKSAILKRLKLEEGKL